MIKTLEIKQSEIFGDLSEYFSTTSDFEVSEYLCNVQEYIAAGEGFPYQQLLFTDIKFEDIDKIVKLTLDWISFNRVLSLL